MKHIQMYKRNLCQYPEPESPTLLPLLLAASSCRTVSFVTQGHGAADVHCQTVICLALHAMGNGKAITVFAAVQNPASFRTGLLAISVNGLAPTQGDMAPERGIVFIKKHRGVVATA